MNFEETLSIHLNAIINRSIQDFIPTLDADLTTLILPNGTYIQGREAVITFHEDWFNDLDWSLSYKLLESHTSDNQAYALLDVTYSDLDEQRKTYEISYYLTLIFRKTNSDWGLVLDQNTLKPSK